MLIYIDVETTGLELKDRICCIGIIAVDDDGACTTLFEYINPQQKLKPHAMMIHHITNEMVKEAPIFKASEALAWLQKHNSSANTLIAHHAGFDLEMLIKEGFIWQGEVIDTLKCMKHLVEDCEAFSLEFLRYELQLYKSEQEVAERLNITITPHNAISDALHVKMVHEYLKTLADDERLIELTRTAVVMQKFTFGKYKGRYIEEIAMQDRGYLEWMLHNIHDDEDLHYTVEYYLGC
jgi:DNA polymerase-3 subunit epsilon/exodeoxyribonuclease X